MSLSPAAYISAKSHPLPAAGGVRSSATDHLSRWVFEDGFAPTVTYVALPVGGPSGAVCADIGGVGVPTVGYMRPIADAARADEFA